MFNQPANTTPSIFGAPAAGTTPAAPTTNLFGAKPVATNPAPT